jgi:hypothetical protein
MAMGRADLAVPQGALDGHVVSVETDLLLSHNVRDRSINSFSSVKEKRSSMHIKEL